MTTVALVGGGGHALVIADILRQSAREELAGYTDIKNRGALLGLPYLGTDEVLVELRRRLSGLQLALGIGHVGDVALRRRLVTRLLSEGHQFISVVSARSAVADSATVAEGAAIMTGAIVNPLASVGRYAIVNSNAVIEHGTWLGEHVHVAPGAVVCGDCRVGEHCMIGAGAVITQGSEIAANCLIAAGAVVNGALLEAGTYFGCPARRAPG